MDDDSAGAVSARCAMPTERSLQRMSTTERYAETNNEDLVYLKMPIILPSAILTVVSVVSFLFALLLAIREDILPPEEQMRRGLLIRYGSKAVECNTTILVPQDGLLSVLFLFERNVSGNILFRVAVCIPIAGRIFQSMCLRSTVQKLAKSSVIFDVTNDLMPAFSFIEAFALALFSIITINFDSADLNRFAKMVFAISAALNMLTTTLILFKSISNSKQRLDTISLGVKMVTSFVFLYLSPQYFQQHAALSTLPMCHSYSPKIHAIIEYLTILSYGLFHLTWLIDIRNVHFICYPRTCSGECEPLDPANFVVGGKYERSYLE